MIEEEDWILRVCTGWTMKNPCPYRYVDGYLIVARLTLSQTGFHCMIYRASDNYVCTTRIYPDGHPYEDNWFPTSDAALEHGLMVIGEL